MKESQTIVNPYPSPISYKGEYHYRSGSTKQQLKGAALETFLLRKQGRHWDSVPTPYAKEEDLDANAFKQFRRAAAKSGRMDASVLEDSPRRILENLNLIEGGHLRRAAVLLFHETPERFITGAYVKIGFFRTDADLIYQDEVQGNLFDQARKTLDLLLTKYMKAYIRYEGITRVERFLFPPEALRELILNALVHRDYGSGAPIQIRVYEDQLWIANDAIIPPDFTVEHLLSRHVSKPHNPLIAGAFFRTGDIESWGRGIEKVRTACEENGTDFPSFRFEPTGLMVMFKGRIPVEEATPTETEASGKRRENVGKVSGKILDACRENPSITIPEMAELIGITERSIQRNIQKLKTDGFLCRVGGRKEGHWEVTGENGELKMENGE
ncbi:ATP-binding protein [Desulfosudis oleivorans]|uniref:Putative transcriptional regulator n=1 Tax=Desulfosudis oleivorans (strain DSM 6200 / JCM 39069 / Hxd3) TaxID=96561 RepID=A8ZS42_DESOH|nr:ATP-binding protein [Desulfosudis oleivorans]ABW66060.1 putative transcriptional regulator [Desulfosudis oleivorans Hxd3]